MSVKVRMPGVMIETSKRPRKQRRWRGVHPDMNQQVTPQGSEEQSRRIGSFNANNAIPGESASNAAGEVKGAGLDGDRGDYETRTSDYRDDWKDTSNDVKDGARRKKRRMPMMGDRTTSAAVLG